MASYFPIKPTTHGINFETEEQTEAIKWLQKTALRG